MRRRRTRTRRKGKRQSATVGTLVTLAVLIAAVSLTQALTVSPATDKSSEQVKSASCPTVKYALKELLNKRGRSKDAALFAINDEAARPIHLGESIGSSGWSLVDVREGEAIIRRNGEVRSIYVGQALVESCKAGV